MTIFTLGLQVYQLHQVQTRNTKNYRCSHMETERGLTKFHISQG